MPLEQTFGRTSPSLKFIPYGLGLLTLIAFGATLAHGINNKHVQKAQADPDVVEVSKPRIVPESVKYAVALFKVGQQSSYCAAIIVGKGKLLTAGHCIEGDIEHSVLMELSNGKVIPQGHIKVLYASPDISKGDVALLYSDALEGFAGPAFNRDTPYQGQDVFAYGNPFGFDFTLAEGYVSYVGRDIPMTEVKNELQLNLGAMPGNSGGPLYDKETGALIGIVNATMNGGQSQSFAVGMDTICTALLCEEINGMTVVVPRPDVNRR